MITTPPFDFKAVNVAAQKTDPGSLWHAIRWMVNLRQNHPAFSVGGLEWIDTGSEAILAFYRSSPTERLLVVHNLSAKPQEVS